MAKKTLQGLDNMFNPNPNQEQAPTTPVQGEEPTAKEKNTTTKPICYNIAPELIEAMSYIAYFDRRKVNAVVMEAFTDYIRKWNNSPHTIEQPKTIEL